MNNKILIVDEDESVHAQIQNALSKNGYTVLSAKNGRDGLEVALKEAPALVILEAYLPELDGFSVCKSLRAEGFKSPIIFLTSKISEIDAVIGLELGAQDYIRKPLQTKELLVRIEVQLKKNQEELTNKKITIQDLEIDLERRKVKHKGQVKELTHKEFQLLYALAQCPNKVFSRNELLNNVWGWSQFGQTRTVDIHIGYLRKKFEENPRKPKILQTIRGVGYTLNTE
ncbi:MAG: response regulator transcription factor [Candidatus Melainabacteria bacterium]|nr:response regulator transcription factor [Candidatus Melainabacteria bacterium]